MTRTMLDLRLFTIRLGSYTFSPKLIPTVVTLLLLYLLYSLGQWQLSRAQSKESLKLQIDSRSELKPVGLAFLPKAEEEKQFVPVKISGRFHKVKSFLLDNRIMDTHAGFNVVTPFETEQGAWVLVNRGWIPRTKYRKDLPKFDTPSGEMVLSGFVRTPYEKVFMLQEQQYDLTRWPVIVQSVNIKELGHVLDKTIKPYVVYLNEESAGGFNRNWPAYKLDSTKHIGYAVQWFALFSALLGIFFIVNTKRNKEDE